MGLKDASASKNSNIPGKSCAWCQLQQHKADLWRMIGKIWSARLRLRGVATMAFVRKCPALVALAACGTCLGWLRSQDMLEIPNGTFTSCTGTYCLHIPLLPLVQCTYVCKWPALVSAGQVHYFEVNQGSWLVCPHHPQQLDGKDQTDFLKKSFYFQLTEKRCGKCAEMSKWQWFEDNTSKWQAEYVGDLPLYTFG